MDKFIPLEKLSKNMRRERHAAKRGSWNGVNPVTRKPANPKAYNRKKARKWSEDFSITVPFSFAYNYSVSAENIENSKKGRCEMALIGNPFIANVTKQMSGDELMQAIRVDIPGELEAIIGYEAHAMSTNDERVKKLLYHIADEEREHVGGNCSKCSTSCAPRRWSVRRKGSNPSSSSKSRISRICLNNLGVESISA